MANFSEISKKYENDSVIQKSAREILFELLAIQPNDNVLDLGCDTGHISKLIRDKTIGRVVGVDPSNGMIEKAQENFQSIIFPFMFAQPNSYILKMNSTLFSATQLSSGLLTLPRFQ